jgi:hypothetical protein
MDALTHSKLLQLTEGCCAILHPLAPNTTGKPTEGSQSLLSMIAQTPKDLTASRTITFILVNGARTHGLPKLVCVRGWAQLAQPVSLKPQKGWMQRCWMRADA